MTPCRRFEQEGLLRLEQGLALDPHFDTCPECREAQAAYARLRNEMNRLASGEEPPPDWRANVFESVERKERARRVWRWVVTPSAAAASLMLAAVVGHQLLSKEQASTPPGRPPSKAASPRPGSGRPSLPPPEDTLGMTRPDMFDDAPLGAEARRPAVAPDRLLSEILPGPRIRRGTGEAQLGDRLILRAQVGESPFAELRVYRDDHRLVLRCTDKAPCRREGGELRAELALESTGRYQGLLLLSSLPLPEPLGSLDRDFGAAAAAGAQLELDREIHVR